MALEQSTLTSEVEIKETMFGKWICWTAQHLGPAFIKIIQTISTRDDMFSPRLLKSFKKMRHTVPRESPKCLEKSLNKVFGRDYREIFNVFEFNPIGCGCVAEVHKAQLKTGEVVAVKILRPNIEKRTRRSIMLLKVFCQTWSKLYRLKRRSAFDFENLIDPLEELLMAQTNLTTEMENINKFHDALKREGFRVRDEDQIKVPKIYEKWSSKNVLVMEFVEGIHPDRYKELNHDAIDLAHTLDNLEDMMILYNGLVHGDLHPGNFFWLPGPKVVLMDFGLIIEIPKYDIDTLLSFYMAIVDGYCDYAVHFFLERFVLPSVSEKLNESEYLQLFNNIYKIYITDSLASTGGKPNFFEVTIRMQAELSRFGLKPRKSLIQTFLTLTTLEGYIYNLDKSFNMLDNARQKKLEAAEYTELPQHVLEAIFGNFMTYSMPMFENGKNTVPEAFEKIRTFIGRVLNVKKGDKIFDIGCGRGKLLEVLKYKFGAMPYGITLSSVEYNHCKKNNFNVEHVAWERSDDYLSRIGPVNHIVISEMILHISTLEENKLGFTEIKLDRLFMLCHKHLVEDGKIYIQDYHLNEKIFAPENAQKYQTIVETFRFVGFSRYEQVQTACEPYFEIVDYIDGTDDLAPAMEFFIDRITKNYEYISKETDPRLTDCILKECILMKDLAEENFLKLYRVILKKRSSIDKKYYDKKLTKYKIARTTDRSSDV